MIDYIDFDEDGIKEIRCMICNIPVKVRKELSGKLMLMPLAHYKEITVGLEEDGKPHSQATIIGCKKCSEKPIDFSELMKTINHGWEKEMKAAKADQKEIDKYLKKYKKVKVKKRLNKEVK